MFKNGPSKICGRQPLQNLKGDGPPKAEHDPKIFLRNVFNKFCFAFGPFLNTLSQLNLIRKYISAWNTCYSSVAYFY